MSDSSPPHASPVGTLAEETLKLLGTLAAGSGHASGGHRTTEGAADTGTRADTATGTGTGTGAHADHEPNCTYCPVCQLIGFVRETSPETLEHLNASMESLTLAVRGLLDTVVSHPKHPKPNARRDAGVENIDLSEDEPWD